MVIALVILSIGMIVGGYYLMGLLDKNLKQKAIPMNEEPTDVMVLIFGSEGIVRELAPALKKAHIPCRVTTEMDYPKGIRCQHVLAISDDDLENLLFCTQVKHSWPEAHLIASCNDRIHKQIFHEAGIHSIIMDPITSASVLSFLKGGGLKLS